jgi:hypothetical protein
MSTFEIPLQPFAQKVAIQLGATSYNLTIYWNDVPESGWIMDIFDDQDNPIVCGIPLVTGCDLFEQYSYLGFNGKLFCGTDGNMALPPTYSDLGATAHLWWQPNA